MTKKLPDPSDSSWLERFMSGTGPVAAGVPAFRPLLSHAERKADDTNRHVREITDAAAEQRLTTSARLKVLRLEKEAEDRAKAASRPPKARKPKAKS